MENTISQLSGVGVITHKLWRQSLEEELAPHLIKNEDHDSGTESDKENSENDYWQELAGNPLVVHAPNFLTPTPQISSTKRPFQPLNQSRSCSQLSSQDRISQSDHYKPKAQEFESLQGTCDTESRGSVLSDFILSMCVPDTADLDGYSSEDELSSINCENSGLRLGGKRTWSKVNCQSDASSSGIWESWSDEGMNEEASPMPLNFSSSPPKGVSRFSHTMSPKVFLASVLPASSLCSASINSWKKPR